MPKETHGAFQGVLVDLFGTLVPALSRQARNPHLLEMGEVLGLDPVSFAADWGESFRDRVVGQLGSLEETVRRISARQGLAPSADGVRRAVGIRLAFSRSLLDSCRPVLPALDALRSAGLRLAVVSDTSAETPRLWSSSPLRSRFDATVFSCETGFCKPDPRMYLLALERIGLPADRCAFVGDGGSHELTGATAVGLSAFLYRFPNEGTDPDPRYDPDTNWNAPPLRDLRDLLAPRQ